MYALIEEFGEVFFLLAVLLVFVAVLVVAVVATIATRLHSGGVSDELAQRCVEVGDRGRRWDHRLIGRRRFRKKRRP